jgi:cytochrome c-type biogenesis protein CcmH/NrfG
VWAVLGEARARRALGESDAAARALEAAVRLEPHCAPAWLEIGLARVEEGELATARQALSRVEAALAAARRRPPESDYERALVRVERGALARLRVRCGVRG